jgi:hypothetical protein
VKLDDVDEEEDDMDEEEEEGRDDAEVEVSNGVLDAVVALETLWRESVVITPVVPREGWKEVEPETVCVDVMATEATPNTWLICGRCAVGPKS